MSEAPRRRSRVLPLVLALLVLLSLLCGLIWIFRSLIKSPERAVIQGDSPGIRAEWGAFQYRNARGKLTPLNGPVGVAYDGNNRIYVSLPTSDTVVVFDADGTNGRVFIQDNSAIQKKSLSEYLVIAPTGMDVDSNGNLWVASSRKAAVSEFAPDGTRLREIPVMAPRYVHVAGERLYVLGKGTLYVFDRDGTPVGQWGTYGRGTNQLAYPMGVTTLEDGTILISDTNNYRIVALTPALEPVWFFGKSATSQSDQNARILASPGGIAVGGDAPIIMVDMLNHYMRAFDAKGTMIGGPLGAKGTLDNQFYFPIGIDHMDGDLFVVTDQGNNRVLGVHVTPGTTPRVTPKQSLESTPLTNMP